MNKLILRPYQEKAIAKVLQLKAKTNKQVLVLATGTGKTVIFSHLIDELIKQTGKKALVLAHREELLQQAKDKLRAVNLKLKIEIEQGNNHAGGYKTNVITASVPTLGRENSTRLKKFDPKDFCCIIVDESHHSTTDTYKTILKYFGVLKKQKDETEVSDWNKDCLLLGVTATPSRTDNKGINTIYDKIAFEYHIVRAIKDGYLSPIRAFRVNTQTDLSMVGRVAGDFNQGQLADTVNNPARNFLIVKTYLDRLGGKQALVFCVDIEHTKAVNQEFLDADVKSAYITGTTKKEERKQILEDFRNKKIQVLVNCMTLTEGVDVPSVDAVLLARPTQSSILFSQMVGRGTRLYPGKEYLTIVDFLDLTNTHRLQTTSSLLGLNTTLDFQGKDIIEAKENIDKLIELNPNYNLDNLDLSRIDYVLQEIDILSNLKIPQDVAGFTQLDWFLFRENYYRLSLPENRIIHIYQTILEEYEILDEAYHASTRSTISTHIGIKKTLKEAFEYADNYVLAKYPQFRNLLDSSAAWKKLQPKEGQVKYLRKMGIGENQIAQLDRGSASRLLSKLFSFTRAERKQFIQPMQQNLDI